MVTNEEALKELSDLMDGLTDDERQRVQKELTVRTYRKNEAIYAEGEAPTRLLCLISGKVKIFKEGVGRRSQIVRVLNAVQYFGYRAGFSGENYVTSAAAFEPSLIASIPITLIRSLIMQNTHLAWFFIKKLSDDLGQSDERTVNLTQKHIRGRLAESLLFLKEKYGLESDGHTLSITLSREDLANLSNMTTSNAIRTLSLFAAENLVAIEGRRIKIVNEEELQKVSRMG